MSGAARSVAGRLVVVSTGFVDAYTFIAHGGVFAEAMTGNSVLTAVGFLDRGLVTRWHAVTAVVSFTVGAVIARLVAGRVAARPRVVPAMTLAAAVAVMVMVGAVPGLPTSVVIALIAAVSSWQIGAFNHVGAVSFATIVMTTNTFHAVDAVVTATRTRTRADRMKAVGLVVDLAAFAVGIAIGVVATRTFSDRAAWVAAGLFVSAAAAFFWPHPADARAVR